MILVASLSFTLWPIPVPKSTTSLKAAAGAVATIRSWVIGIRPPIDEFTLLVLSLGSTKTNPLPKFEDNISPSLEILTIMFVTPATAL